MGERLTVCLLASVVLWVRTGIAEEHPTCDTQSETNWLASPAIISTNGIQGLGVVCAGSGCTVQYSCTGEDKDTRQTRSRTRCELWTNACPGYWYWPDWTNWPDWEDSLISDGVHVTDWSASAGSITADGLFTPPPAAGMVTITATLDDDAPPVDVGSRDDTPPKVSTQIVVAAVSFTVTSDDPGAEQLTDNHEATVTIEGIQDPSGLSFTFSSAPVASGCIINKKGTAIGFVPTANPLIWRTTPTYWYGVLPEQECQDQHHAYSIAMAINGCHTVSNQFTVGWPSEDPKMNPLDPTSQTSVSPAEPVPGIPNLYRCLIVFGDFIKSHEMEGLPTTDQYADETWKEEHYHKDQWYGAVADSEGGQQDCFTAKGVKWAINWVGDGPWYTYGFTTNEAWSLAIAKATEGVTAEQDISWETWSKDRGFIELKAKAHAGYNAAWTYHCIYEDQYTANPTNHHHPAY